MRQIGMLSISFLFLASMGCGGSQQKDVAAAGNAMAAKAPGAVAALEPRSGSQIAGTAEFSDAGNGAVAVTVKVANAAPGKHGVHLHTTGDCSAADAASAGAHFNPSGANHGGPDSPTHHAGDLGNMDVGADGTGTLSVTTKDLSLAAAPNGVIGRAVVVHEKADDLSSQPAGNSGARQACGVVQAAPPAPSMK
jgi:Cu-Zn family superoxide dismutase